MKILYFAWLRQRIGVGAEDLNKPACVTTVGELVAYLIEDKSKAYATAFREMEAIRVAVNQEYVSFDRQIENGDEIAFFPPVTGG